MAELHKIGSMTNRSKALIYALQEVELMPLKELKTEIAKRVRVRDNPVSRWLT